MANLVVNGAILTCSFGVGPCVMNVPGGTVTACGNAAATIMNNSISNVSSFIMCTTPSNPAVAAAMGIPQPCSPVLVAPWSPGKAQVMIGGIPALDSGSMLNCAYGGVISVSYAGEVTVNLN